MALSALGTAVLWSRAMPEPPRKPFDRRMRERVRRMRPDYVVIGNSMVETRIDSNLLNELLAPAKVAVLGVGGSKSAVWYLTLKNVVLSVSRPRRVIIFFRDRELTNPRERAVGAEHYRVERVMLDDEPVLARKLAPSARTLVPYVSHHLERFSPLANLRVLSDPFLDGLANFSSEWLISGPDPKRRRKEINALFELSELREAAAPAPEVSSLQEPDFSSVLEASFLPDILDVAERAQVKLTFVRVRTRDWASGAPAPRAELDYRRDLRSYVTSRRAEFVDLSEASWESLDMYGEGDHIAGRFRRQYTRLLVEHVGAQIFH